MKLNDQVNIFNSVSFQDKLLFTRHVAVMLKSGVPISEAVKEIEDQTKNPYFKTVLKKISSEIANGQSLEKALLGFPKIFDPLYTNLVKIGEESGNLEANLEYLADQLKKDYQFRQKVVSASLYPAIVLVTVAVVGFGISLFVLPKLIDLFKSLDTTLPLSTKILLWFASVMQKYGVFIFSALIALGLLFRYLISLPKIKRPWEEFLFTLPAIGPFLQNVQLTVLCRNLGIMLKSGLPITTALEAQGLATSNLIYQGYLESMQKGIEKGEDLGKSLENGQFKYIPKMVGKMIGVGEKSGNLEESFLYLGNYFEDEVDTATKNLSNVLEPVLLLVIGLIVAFVAMAIITPIYQFTGSIKR